MKLRPIILNQTLSGKCYHKYFVWIRLFLLIPVNYLFTKYERNYLWLKFHHSGQNYPVLGFIITTTNVRSEITSRRTIAFPVPEDFRFARPVAASNLLSSQWLVDGMRVPTMGC